MSAEPRAAGAEPSVDAAAAAAMALLRRVRGLTPALAEVELRALAERLLPLRLDLVPERNHYSGALDHGVLIRAAGETAYVTCRGPQSTPWLLQQVHDFREGMLLAVDAETLSVGETVAAIDELLEHASLRQRLIDACIINGALKRRDYVVSDDELQREVNAMRRRRGLVTAADTERWLRARGMSQQQLEQVAQLAVRTRQLRRELCAADVDAHFAARRETLARAALVRIRFANAELARRAGARLSSRESFFALAEELLGQDARHGVTTPRLDGQVVARHELDPELAAEVFARPGTIAGPHVTPDGAYLLYVSAIEQPRELDAEQRQLIERELFARWLEEQRALAIIDWNWGRDR